MKKKLSFLFPIVIGIASVILFFGCSSQQRAYMPVPDQSASSGDRSLSQATTANKASTTAPSNTLTELNQAAADRKIVYDATLKIQVDSLADQSTEVLKIVNGYGGYVLYTRKDYAKIRVPSKELQSVLKDVKSLGTVLEESITGKDITDEFFDIQTRLDNAEKTRGRYLALLDKATTIPEILQLEKELERLNNQIERYKGQIKRLSELEAYATITIHFQPKIAPKPVVVEKKAKPGPLGYVFVGLYKGVKWLFVRTPKT